MTKTGIYIQKSIKKIMFFLWKGLIIFLVYFEEIALKHFLYINIRKFRLFFFLRWLKNRLKIDVYITVFLKLSHTLKRNLTKLVDVQKEKNTKLKIFISSLFQGKQSWNLISRKKSILSRSVTRNFLGHGSFLGIRALR